MWLCISLKKIIYKFMNFKQWLLSEMPVISLQGKTVLADDKPLKEVDVDNIKNNIVFFRVPEDTRHIYETGTTWVYFLDSEESAEKMKAGHIPMLMVPQGTFSSGGNPITDVWKKRFAREGTEHILGILEGNTTEDEIYINMMTVRPKYKRNTINTKMIQFLQKIYPNAKLFFSDATPEGEKFINKYTKMEK